MEMSSLPGVRGTEEVEEELRLAGTFLVLGPEEVEEEPVDFDEDEEDVDEDNCRDLCCGAVDEVLGGGEGDLGGGDGGLEMVADLVDEDLVDEGGRDGWRRDAGLGVLDFSLDITLSRRPDDCRSGVDVLDGG